MKNYETDNGGINLREAVIKKILEKKVIANIRGVYGQTCLNLASALRRGGIELISIAFDPKDTQQNLRAHETLSFLVRQLGYTVTFGVSNLTNLKMVESVKNAGAAFVISPDANDAMIMATTDAGMVSIAGARTPKEVIYAHNCGADFVNVFPARSMEPADFVNIHNVINHIPILAFGGINQYNVKQYMRAGVAGVCVDDCFYSVEQIANGEWEQIASQVVSFVQTI